MDRFRLDPPRAVARTPRLMPGDSAPSLLRVWDHGVRPGGLRGVSKPPPPILLVGKASRRRWRPRKERPFLRTIPPPAVIRPVCTDLVHPAVNP